MTDPVETLVLALRQVRDDAAAGARLRDVGIEPVARALLAEITPAIVAEAVAREMEACAKLAQSFSRTKTYSDEFLGTITGKTLTSGDRIAAAIRARGNLDRGNSNDC